MAESESNSRFRKNETGDLAKVHGAFSRSRTGRKEIKCSYRSMHLFFHSGFVESSPKGARHRVGTFEKSPLSPFLLNVCTAIKRADGPSRRFRGPRRRLGGRFEGGRRHGRAGAGASPRPCRCLLSPAAAYAMSIASRAPGSRPAAIIASRIPHFLSFLQRLRSVRAIRLTVARFSAECLVRALQ